MRHVSVQRLTTNYTASEVKDTASSGVRRLTQDHMHTLQTQHNQEWKCQWLTRQRLEFFSPD